MSSPFFPETPAFLDSGQPAVPDIVVPRGITPFFLPRRPVRGRLIRLGPLADALLTRHDHPRAVTRLLVRLWRWRPGSPSALEI